jgi:hypothetical protein
MTKVFTVDQANRTLPLVRRIVEDIVRQYARWQECVTAIDAASASHLTASVTQVEVLQRQAQALAEEIEGYAAELADLGIEMKGPDIGLIDFPGQMNGRPVCLCWRLGEPSVQYWHELDGGFAGRRPLLSVASLTETS